MIYFDMADDEIKNHLKHISTRLEAIDRNVTAIDASIQGDDARGVIGIKQHIATIVKNYHDHIEGDEREFNAIKQAQETIEGKISERQTVIEKKIDKATWWLMGAAAVIGGIFYLIEIL